MSDSPQIVSSVVVDETGTAIVHDSRPDNLEEDEFWACTHRAVIKAACVIQERDGVIPESGVFVSPDALDRVGLEGEDVTRAQQFVTAKFPGWRIVETDSNGETRVVELSTTEE
jgi:hypothetical protein